MTRKAFIYDIKYLDFSFVVIGGWHALGGAKECVFARLRSIRSLDHEIK